jgi:predicted nucleotidyltransferase
VVQRLDGAAVVGAAWLPVTNMELSTHPTVQRVLDRARQDPTVLAVILFGSHARGEASAASDVDLCLVLASDSMSSLEMSHIRLAYLGEGAVDVVIFQQLPLHVKSRVLKEGRVLFASDEDALYDAAIRAARAFEGFRHRYRAYLDEARLR